MADKYKSQIEFLLIYIREAHPTDGWQVQQNKRDGVLLPSARTFDEKAEHATACVRNLGIKFTTLVDNSDNQVELEYAGWPDRLYLIDKEGRVTWKGAPGPAGFKPQELEEAIQGVLRMSKSSSR